MRFTLKQLLALIIEAKRKGTGKIGNGRLFVMLLSVLIDCNPEFVTSERTVLHCFSDQLNKNDAYHAVDRRLYKIIRAGQPYPHEKMHFSGFEAALNAQSRYAVYLKKMSSVCETIFEPKLTESFVYSVLQAIRQDTEMQSVLYGRQYIAKEMLSGSPAHPVRISLPALLLGLLYQLHNGSPEESEETALLPLPNTRLFRLVSFPKAAFHNSSELAEFLTLNVPENIADAITLNAHYLNQKISGQQLYPIEFEIGTQTASDIPDSGNMYLYGNAAIGKTTYLRGYAHENEAQVNLYLPLYQYKKEIYPAYHTEYSCWILLQILLKYRYQNAYQTYEICAAYESESGFLTELCKLDKLFSEQPNRNKPQYCLILDGIHEVPLEYQSDAVYELEMIAARWENVRLIISGRKPAKKQFQDFQKVKLCGVSDSVFSQYADDTAVQESLKSPLFLEFSQSNKDSVNTRSALLDAYFEQCLIRQCSTAIAANNMRFLVKLALPYIAFTMAHRGETVIDKSELCGAIRKAISFFFDNERVYQNYTLSHDIMRDSRFSVNQYADYIRNHLAIMEEENSKYLLRFSHKYFRDYFAAKHIVTVVSALRAAYELKNTDELQRNIFEQQLHEIWFQEHDSEIYRIIGEITLNGLDLNNVFYAYEKTPIGYLLDTAKITETFRLTENIISTIAAYHNNVVCGVIFRDLQMPMWIPAYIKFSVNGENASVFEYCYFGMVGLFDADIYAKYSQDHSHIYLHWSEDSYTAEFDLSDYSMIAEYYHDDEFEGVSIANIDEQIVQGIFRNLPHFRGCVFRNIKFWDENGRAKKWLLPY